MLEIHLSHLEYITAVGQEYIASFAVFGHILVLTFFERFQLCRIITFYPAGFIQANRFPAAFCVIFVFKTILDYLKLQLSYSTDNLAAVELIDKQLSHTFVPSTDRYPCSTVWFSSGLHSQYT